MNNFFDNVLQHPEFYRQFNCGKSLITAFNCPMEARLMKSRLASCWTEYNYLFYAVDGQKIWHTAGGRYDIRKDSCVFVRKGGFVLEQLPDTGFCVVLFFIPDEFIRETLQHKLRLPAATDPDFPQVMPLDCSDTLAGFFLSMSAHFANEKEPDQALLELKFRELVLTIADNPANEVLLGYFHSLFNEPATQTLVRVMEDNYRFNLTLPQFARLSCRSLSAFKRDFQEHYHTTPGKWLLEKRLLKAASLLRINKSITDAAFETGFENNTHFSRAFKLRFGVSPSVMRATPVATT